ncbi:MAG: SDR family oxidoreductase [Chloroflexota bacterium]
MKVAIFGGTGKGGQFLVPRALDAGHEVVVLSRNPSKLTLQHERLKLVKGSIQDAASVDTVIQGVDAVLSSLGANSKEPPFSISKGFDNILNSMHQHNVRRLIMSVGAVIFDPLDKPQIPNYLFHFIWVNFQKNPYEDMLQVVEKVRASDLDWTIVRVPYLTERFSKPGTLRVGYLGDIGSMITRTDMSDFMVKQLESDTWVRKAPAISN